MQDIVLFISEHIILMSIWFFFLITVILSIIPNLFLKCKFINNIQAINLINKNNAILIDTRPIEIFKRGHIINSLNIPLNEFNLKSIQANNLYKNSYIILIFHKNHEYNQYIKKLIKYEFKNIYILKNGIYHWNLNHLPLVVKD